MSDYLKNRSSLSDEQNLVEVRNLTYEIRKLLNNDYFHVSNQIDRGIYDSLTKTENDIEKELERITG